MKSWIRKWSIWFACSLLCLAWIGGQAQSSEGKKVGWAGQLKRLYLSLNARMTEVEEKVRIVRTEVTSVMGAKKEAKSATRLAIEARQNANAARNIAHESKERARRSEIAAYAAISRAEKAAQTATLRAEKAERELKKLQEQTASQRKVLQVLKNRVEDLMQRTGTRRVYGVGSVEFAVRWISAGTFVMGSPANESGREKDEGPQRQVRISRGLWMMETEVTQGLYKALMGSNPSYFSSCGDNCPVEWTSWHEAQTFANKLSEKQGLKPCTGANREIFECEGWRLPTEAEWEYAARAGTTEARYGKFWDIAWHSGNSGGQTHPVGEKEPNAWGLKDMLGNVCEWTLDWSDDSYKNLGNQDPLQIRSSTVRIIRGGGFSDFSKYVRSAYRNGEAPSGRYNYLGFRLVRR